MTDPLTHVQEPYDQIGAKVVTSILTAAKDAVNAILEIEGIIELDIPQLEMEDDDENRNAVMSIQNRTSSVSSGWSLMTPDVSLSSRTDVIITPTTTPGFQGDHIQSIGEAEATNFGYLPFRETRHSPLDPFSSSSITEVNLANHAYSELLLHVAQAARIAEFPRCGYSSSGNSFGEDLSSFNKSLMFQSSSQLERDRKVGAAGELFVSQPCHCHIYIRRN